MCQSISRDSPEAFNSKVGMLTPYLGGVRAYRYAIFWGHGGFLRAKADFYAPDGVNLNSTGHMIFFVASRGQYCDLCAFCLALLLPKGAFKIVRSRF